MGIYGEVLDKVSDLITAAFGLVAALAWNGAIQALFLQIFGTTETLPAQFTYAVVVTVVAVLATIWIARMAARAGAEKKE